MVHALLVVSVWLHIVAAIVWVGGMTFLSLTLVPVLRQPEHHDQAAGMIQLTGRRFRTVGWICFVVLAVTGVVNLYARGWLAVSDGFWKSSQGEMLLWKIGLFTFIIIISLIHDFAIGPAAVGKMKDDPGGAKALSLRRTASWIGRVNLGLALVIVALAVLIVRGVPW